MTLVERIDRMNKQKPVWIPEEQAAQKLGYKPETLRRYVKAGKLDISYTTLAGRKFQYDERGIERALNQKAIFIQ